MVGMTVGAVGISFFGSFLGYMLLFEFMPQLVNDESWVPTGTDWGLWALLAVPGVAIAAALSIKLADRILEPLNSLAQSARSISDGDLTARAEFTSGTFVEIALLVADFNQMSEKLQGHADSLTAWNAAVAHEIRTPLTILKGRVQGAMDGVFVTDQKLLENLMQQIDGLSRLVDDLRMVTLADSGRLELRISSIDLASELHQTVEMIRPSLERSGHRVETRLRPFVVPADSMRIRQAVLALLTNVERYAVPGIVRVSCMMLDNAVEICVEDSGPGLPPEFINRAFDPFMRAEAPAASDSGGSGLGLSVVRAIALAHGGSVRYRTLPDGGALFTILLPLQPPAVAARREPAISD
jgi:two-component system, OmpR family, sensor histidine kinase AdeS